MKKTILGLIAGLACVLLVTPFVFSVEKTADFNTIPANGTVTMIDLGAKKCIPCKMMAPILVKLEEAYRGKADIVFIDVWENNEQARRFGIRSIPTQIFFDAEGREIYRHTGFMDETAIIGQLSKMGIPAPETAPVDDKG
ncbi:thioredoxin family protein [Desulfatiferula olefinivorans]